MKSNLLLFGALALPAEACEFRESLPTSIEPDARVIRVAITQPSKSPSKNPSPTAPSTPAPKPADKQRNARPARPAYLFL